MGTVSDIYDYLRLMYARVGHPHCYDCGLEIRAHTVQEVVDDILGQDAGRLTVCAPRTYDPALDFGDVLERIRREGFVRVRIDGEVFLLEDDPPAPAAASHAEHKGHKGNDGSAAAGSIELVVDRLKLSNPDPQRLTEAVEQAYHFGGGTALLVYHGEGGEREATYSRTPRCPRCGITYPEPQPRIFSFNSPYGACPDCHGLGVEDSIDVALIAPDTGKSLADGAIVPWEKKSSAAFHQMLEQVARHYGFSIFDPFESLSPKHREVILHGSGNEALEFTYDGEDSGYRYTKPFEGVIPNLERRYRETESSAVREEIRRYMTSQICRGCNGARLRRESLHYLIDSNSVAQVSHLPLDETRDWVRQLELNPIEAGIAAKLIGEIEKRLGFLIDVGLHYLTLDRTMDTLSTGEAQRVVLATQIGSALSGVIYILDEPTIGLHQRDTQRLLGTLRNLRDAGNTVVVVEHDRETLLQADYLVEIGPQAGEAGGRLVAAGTPQELRDCPDSLTGRYLSGVAQIALPTTRRRPTWQRLRLAGADRHNLKGVAVEIPLGMIVCVTGVSGSGKSTLVLETLLPAILQRLHRPVNQAPPQVTLKGVEYLDRVIHVNQSPIGKTSRSNPGTYLGVFNQIRELFAGVPESRSRGYTARRFSFNVSGGRCETCQGDGMKRIEMHFLPDVFIRCDVCGGNRFNRETLEIRYRGKTIADVLHMTLSEIEQFFRAVPAIHGRLGPVLSVGLGYLRLGQPANTLSGGEAQRLKITRELGRRDSGRTLYILDEPTTGLHFEDVGRLLGVLNRLVDSHHSVLIIEHNLEVIKCADYLIELGPEGGEEGGRVIACGTPEEVVAGAPEAHTSRYLKDYIHLGESHADAPRAEKERYLHTNGANPI